MWYLNRIKMKSGKRKKYAHNNVRLRLRYIEICGSCLPTLFEEIINIYFLTLSTIQRERERGKKVEVEEDTCGGQRKR